VHHEPMPATATRHERAAVIGCAADASDHRDAPAHANALADARGYDDEVAVIGARQLRGEDVPFEGGHGSRIRLAPAQPLCHCGEGRRAPTAAGAATATARSLRLCRTPVGSPPRCTPPFLPSPAVTTKMNPICQGPDVPCEGLGVARLVARR